MKIEVKYPKQTNLYSFVSNLSQWNELVCVPQRKKEWIKRTGKLNQEEEKNLNEFSKVLQEAESNLETIFLFEKPKDIQALISKEISKEKFEIIKQTFKVFEGRFNKVWNEEYENLKVIEKKFNEKKSQIDKNLEDIKKLCGLTKKQLPQKIETTLILSSTLKEDCQGWSFKEKVVLECSGWPKEKIEYLIYSIFLHECFHILFKRNIKLFSNFKSVAHKNRHSINLTELSEWPPEVILEEIVISTFLPEGYLSEKNMNINSRKTAKKEAEKKSTDDFTRLRNFCALHLYDLAKEYTDKDKQLDRFYFEKAIDCIKKFIDLNKKG